MFSQKLLIIDDDETIIFSFKTFLNEDRFEIETAKNGKQGLEKLTQFKPDLVVADYKMPEMTGLEFIKAAKIITPHTPVVIMSAYGDNATKKLFFEEGASDYIEKPFDIEDILSLIEKNICKNKIQETVTNDQFIGESIVIKDVFSKLEKIKNTKITILIEGESGTGKDLIANYIHKNSKLSNGPFISVNCAAIPENLIESELFGYEKGSFTGADEQKIGKFEMAQNGTLFLDEIGELPLTIQAKLLRVLQNKTIERIGSTQAIKSTARIIAATNKNLYEMIHSGTFREDLFYRLTTFPLTIPPLRMRENDIIIITNYLLSKYCKEFEKPLKTLSSNGQAAIKTYTWPGNVRELQNIISRIVLIENNTTVDENMVLEYLPNTKIDKASLDAHELSFISQYTEKELLKIHANETFKLCNYNKSETAKKLGINYRTLIKRLED